MTVAELMEYLTILTRDHPAAGDWQVVQHGWNGDHRTRLYLDTVRADIVKGELDVDFDR